MYERISLMLGRVLTARLAELKREEGQGATEYAIVLAFLIVGLGVTIGVLGVGIGNFLSDVADRLEGLIPDA
jgi:Flp pilus assembly pilin Flp